MSVFLRHQLSARGPVVQFGQRRSHVTGKKICKYVKPWIVKWEWPGEHCIFILGHQIVSVANCCSKDGRQSFSYSTHSRLWKATLGESWVKFWPSWRHEDIAVSLLHECMTQIYLHHQEQLTVTFSTVCACVLLPEIEEIRRLIEVWVLWVVTYMHGLKPKLTLKGLEVCFALPFAALQRAPQPSGYYSSVRGWRMRSKICW